MVEDALNAVAGSQDTADRVATALVRDVAADAGAGERRQRCGGCAPPTNIRQQYIGVALCGGGGEGARAGPMRWCATPDPLKAGRIGGGSPGIVPRVRADTLAQVGGRGGGKGGAAHMVADIIAKGGGAEGSGKEGLVAEVMADSAAEVRSGGVHTGKRRVWWGGGERGGGGLGRSPVEASVVPRSTTRTPLWRSRARWCGARVVGHGGGARVADVLTDSTCQGAGTFGAGTSCGRGRRRDLRTLPRMGEGEAPELSLPPTERPTIRSSGGGRRWGLGHRRGLGGRRLGEVQRTGRRCGWAALERNLGATRRAQSRVRSHPSTTGAEQSTIQQPTKHL